MGGRDLETSGMSLYRPEYDPHVYPPPASEHPRSVDVLALLQGKTRTKRRSSTHTGGAGDNAENSVNQNSEMCCYMCPEKADGGWEGSAPFSAPQSEEQNVKAQAEDPELMRHIAFRRTYYNQFTQDPLRLLGMRKVSRTLAKVSASIAKMGLQGGAGMSA